jgi:hypothetical protein
VSVVYLIALAGVAVAIVWLLADAVLSVSRKPRWETLASRRLHLVQTVERRSQNLPFVGAERRKAAQDEAAEEQEQRAA